MRTAIKEVMDRHERDTHHYDVESLSDQEYYLDNAGDVSMQEWLAVHTDREILINEVRRLNALLRRRRKT